MQDRTIGLSPNALPMERNVIVLFSVVFLFSFGEELWNSFLPKYLEALGASVVVIAAFGTFKDFLDAVYQYPGGILSDRLGEQRALEWFAGLAALGYALYLFSRHPWMIFVGAFFVMAWSSLGSPALFATIGSVLPTERRTLGFSWQSLLRRLPIVFAPALGGILIVRMGVMRGVRVGLAAAVVIAVTTIFLQQRFYIPVKTESRSSIRGIIRTFRSFSPTLKRLLLSDIFARLAEGVAEIFIVLYAINHDGFSPRQFGVLMGIQMAVAIAGYLPAAALSNRFGRKPLVFFTFTCFACFPLVVVLSRTFPQMVGAFAIGGLREFGEPARKAMIVNFADPAARGRHVGLYYLVRNLSVTPAAAIGGWLWHSISPATTFRAAFACGVVGALIFLFFVKGPSVEVIA